MMSDEFRRAFLGVYSVNPSAITLYGSIMVYNKKLSVNKFITSRFEMA